jgi:SEC-C motif-containing protein
VQRCPCGSGDSYADCCERFHAGEPAPTARALMAARFSAFATGHVAYLERTWYPSTRPAEVTLDEGIRWQRLEIVDTVAGGPFDIDGVVEFRAHYRAGNGRGVLHERSRFVREDGEWLYVSGTLDPR